MQSTIFYFKSLRQKRVFVSLTKIKLFIKVAESSRLKSLDRESKQYLKFCKKLTTFSHPGCQLSSLEGVRSGFSAGSSVEVQQLVIKLGLVFTKYTQVRSSGVCERSTSAWAGHCFSIVVCLLSGSRLSRVVGALTVGSPPWDSGARKVCLTVQSTVGCPKVPFQ